MFCTESMDRADGPHLAHRHELIIGVEAGEHVLYGEYC